MLQDSSRSDALPKHPVKKALNPLLTRPPLAFLASFPPSEGGNTTFTADLAEVVDRASPLAQRSEVVLEHYRLRAIEYGNVPGVERVMLTQADLFKGQEVSTGFLVGETDILPEQFAIQEITVYEAIRIHEVDFGLHSPDRDKAPSAATIVAGIEERTPDARIIFHNTLIGWRLNQNAAEAAAQIVDKSVSGERPISVLWVHDPVGSPRELHPLLPTKDGARIAVISGAREQSLQLSLDRMVKEEKLPLPSLDIRVIPNVIDPDYFNGELRVPQNLAELAPNFINFTRRDNLSQNAGEVEDIFFSGKVDGIRLLLNGRPVHNKGVIEAINMAQVLAHDFRQRVTLAVTNLPDIDIEENRQYWEDVKIFLRHNRDKNLKVVFLGGVQQEYMKWLYKQCHLLIAPFDNEGFGLPPAEAALSGLPSVISGDPALLETTGGYAPVIERVVWEKEPATVAHIIYEYLNSSRAQENIRKQQEHINAHYSPAAVRDQLMSIMDLPIIHEAPCLCRTELMMKMR